MKSLIGTWSLLEFKYVNESSKLVSWGESVSGLLIYTPEGHMSLSINNEKDIFFYAGKYTVQDVNQVIHHVTNASNPARMGKDLIRSIHWSESELILSSNSDDFGTGYIKWKKISS